VWKCLSVAVMQGTIGKTVKSVALSYLKLRFTDAKA